MDIMLLNENRCNEYGTRAVQRNNSSFLIFLLFLLAAIIAGQKDAIASVHNTRAIANTNPSPTSNTTFDVRDYGAKGNGKTLDSQAINKAIDAAAQEGGGTVIFPAGTYLSGTIQLKSNITLYLEQGATIKAVSDTSAYDKPEPSKWTHYQDFGHSHFHNSLIWGVGLHDVSILGPGLIDGSGLSRDLDRRDHLPHGLGNKAIALKNCRNVIIKDISIFKGGHFGILATGINNLTIDNLKIDTNRDGMDIDACQNVHISNCTVNSPWDDAIVLKSTHALGHVQDTRNVTISNCIVSGDYKLGSVLNGTFKRFPKGYRVPHTGRIKMGTESDGGFKNITITNCVFDHCGGLALETVDGGHLEDVSISNITMRDIINMPIFLRLGSRMRGPDSLQVGQLKRVNISNIVVYNSASRAASTISGIPGHDVKDVSIHNVRFVLRGGGKKKLRSIKVPEKADGYPEPTMFGTLPSYGFYVRHAKGIDFSNITISTKKKDERPVFQFKDASDVNLHYIKVPKVAGAPVFTLKNVKNFQSFHVRGLPDKKVKNTSDQSF
ncbi:MAG TPA: glycoside hydrolase family 28 protein [Balneolaceae bacterium]|nr:glycoside hydrolase family 28 protein [Balneolaceae bacterium]